MDRLWTPWRYSYITGAKREGWKGVPEELAAWPGPDRGCVFCNLIGSVQWALDQGGELAESAERVGLVIARLNTCFVCLNAYPYSSGHILLVPYRHAGSLLELTREEASELMATACSMERVLREVYHPDGINVGLNLGEAAGAGVADHLHIHMVPRWFGDTNFMTVTGETRILPETLGTTWARIRESFWERVPD
jgi:ATP adenylyltransferase